MGRSAQNKICSVFAVNPQKCTPIGADFADLTVGFSTLTSMGKGKIHTEIRR